MCCYVYDNKIALPKNMDRRAALRNVGSFAIIRFRVIVDGILYRSAFCYSKMFICRYQYGTVGGI